MTSIIVSFDNNLCSSLEISGHANYAKKGFDIVCSGITVATYTSINLIDKINNKCYVLNVDEKSGYLRFDLNYLNLTKEDIDMIQLIIRNLIDMYEEIKSNYSKYLKIEIK